MVKHNQNNYEENTWNDYNGGMSNGRFQQLSDQVRKASYESSKVSVAKQALRNNNISVDQLKSILNESHQVCSKFRPKQGSP